MATSSILHNIEIRNDEEALSLINALETSIKLQDAKGISSTPRRIYKELTDDGADEFLESLLD